MDEALADSAGITGRYNTAMPNLTDADEKSFDFLALNRKLKASH